MRACNYCLSLLIKETGGIRPSGISTSLYLNQYSYAEKSEKQYLQYILKLLNIKIMSCNGKYY